MQKHIDPATFAKNGSEHGHQVAIFCCASQHFNEFPQLRLMYASPNGGKRDKITAANLKAEGVKSGVPDICLPWPNCGKHGLYIELKIGNNKPTEEQYQYIAELKKAGYAAEWVIGWQAAWQLILVYLRGEYAAI